MNLTFEADVDGQPKPVQMRFDDENDSNINPPSLLEDLCSIELAFFQARESIAVLFMEVESTDALYDFYGWLHKNWKRVVAGAIVAAVIAAIVTFVVWSHNEKEAGANQRLLAVPSLIGEAPAGDPASASALLKISEDKLSIDNLHVSHRIHYSFYMHHIRVLKVP